MLLSLLRTSEIATVVLEEAAGIIGELLIRDLSTRELFMIILQSLNVPRNQDEVYKRHSFRVHVEKKKLQKKKRL